MQAAIEEVLADRPDLHKTLMAYFDWGTAVAEDVSQEPPGTTSATRVRRPVRVATDW